MTFEEKRKLSVFVGALDGDKLDRVIEIITQEQPELPGKDICNLALALSWWSNRTLYSTLISVCRDAKQSSAT